MIEQLKQAGLTENEVKVYLALLENGPSLAGGISRKTGMHRRTVYDVTEMLIKKGLIGYILKNNRRFFEASNPNRILDILKEKEDILSPVVSSLMEKFEGVKEKQETNFYKGREGLKTVFEDQLDSKSEILILGASAEADDILQFYFKWYDKKRKKKKIKARIIASDKKFKKVPLTEIRYLPEKYSSPVAVNIYGDKTAIILWASQPIAIVIKNKEIAEGYKKYFEVMWRVGRG